MQQPESSSAGSPGTESWPIYLVAKWHDGSFLRLPARWQADGMINIDQNEWSQQHPQPLLERKDAVLIDVVLHFRTESLEIPVRHTTVTRQRDGKPVVESMFHADLDQMDPWLTPMAIPPIRHAMTAPTDRLNTNRIENSLLGVFGTIDLVLSQPEPVVGLYQSTIERIHGWVDGEFGASGFPHTLATQLRDGSKVALPPEFTGWLRQMVEFTSAYTNPRQLQSRSPEYSCLLALEACHRELLRSLGNYAAERNACQQAGAEADPELQLLFPDFGENDGSPMVFGAEAVIHHALETLATRTKPDYKPSTPRVVVSRAEMAPSQPAAGYSGVGRVA